MSSPKSHASQLGTDVILSCVFEELPEFYDAHTDNEFVPRSELGAAVELYKEYLNFRS